MLMEKEQGKYELAYLISPFVPEEKVFDEVAGLRKAIESRQCLITDEGAPSVRQLAYVLRLPRVGKFESAWFGWVKFISSPENIDLIKQELEKNTNILRFLIIKPQKEPVRKAIKKPAGARQFKPKAPEEKPPVKEEEIDKKIEEMVGV